jgi:hypothetical protein
MIPWWAGPVTVGTAVAAVLIVQWVAVAVLEAPPRFLEGYLEPAIITAVLVAMAVGVFNVVSRSAIIARRTFSRIATIALLVSLLPDVAVGMGWVFVREGWTLATVFMLQHIAAWAVVVGVLPRTVRQRRTHDAGD